MSARLSLRRVLGLGVVLSVLFSAAPAAPVSPLAPAPAADPRPDMVEAAEEASRWSPVPSSAERAAVPEDRYALAGGCYAVQALPDGRYLARQGEGFAAVADGPNGAEPFHLQATDLGSYLLYGSARDYLAASEGALGELLGDVTGHPVGGAVGGLTMETTDEAASALAGGPLGEASGRGGAVVSAAAPSELADWTVNEAGEGTFHLVLPVLGQGLAAGGAGELHLADSAGGFGFRTTTGCAAFPEIEVNVDGPVARGDSPVGEVRGYLDAHLHMMAFEFLGGRARCGRPWHPYGVEHALAGCPEHELLGGRAAVLETFLSGRDPVAGHDTNAGWPTFTDWPAYNSLTYEQVYYKWLERAWRSGLRVFVNLLVDNNQLCKVYPYKRNSCNEMDGVRLQAERIRELERYIDAQHGGPGKGWFRIVTDPFQARRAMNAGQLAVVLGIEVSVPFDCGVFLDVPLCDFDQVDDALDEVYELGVRQMELVNKFDNALTGVAGDAGETGILVGAANALETGRWWQMETCADTPPDHEHGHSPDHGHDRRQINLHDDAGTPEELTGRDALVGIILNEAGQTGAAPLYPPGPHCNTRGLTVLGEHVIRRMIEKGMIFDPDHMSARARAEAMDLVEAEGHPGVVSSHGWADDTIYPRILALGGVVTPYAGNSTSFVEEWRAHKQWVDDRFFFGFGYGADTNGFGSQGAPRGPELENPVTYPFTGLGGVVVHQQHSGERVYDINADGVAHYGLYPDWLEDLRQIAGDELIEDMVRGPEAYLQMWERSVGIGSDSCRPDVPGLTHEDLARVTPGMTAEQVLLALGQPASRAGGVYTYCLADGQTATVAFGGPGQTVTAAPSVAGPGSAAAAPPAGPSPPGVVPGAGLHATGGTFDGARGRHDHAAEDPARTHSEPLPWRLLTLLVALVAVAVAQRRGLVASHPPA